VPDVQLGNAAGIGGDLYPDVVAAGGLPPAVSNALAANGSPLSAEEHDRTGGFPAYARVNAGDRFSQFYVASQERLFIVDFWGAGVCMAKGADANLGLIARAVDVWLRQRPRVRPFAEQYPFIQLSPRAEGYEDGTAVDAKWKIVLEDYAEDLPGLAALFAAAAREPRLRQLYPYISAYRLCFSRCTGYPYTYDCPIISAYPYRRAFSTIAPGGEELFVVSAPDGSKSQPVAAHVAVRLAVQQLPHDCGPARSGTAEDSAES
jgi:hypothetical protein